MVEYLVRVVKTFNSSLLVRNLKDEMENKVDIVQYFDTFEEAMTFVDSYRGKDFKIKVVKCTYETLEQF